MKFQFDTPLYDALLKVDKQTIIIKSCYMGLCSEIDRFFRNIYNIDLFDEVKITDFMVVYSNFPNLKNLTKDQLSILIKTYSFIRNISAHLFLNNRIYVEKTLIDYFTNICTPLYKVVSDDNEITLFGVFYILSFLSVKEPIWTFCTKFFREEMFDEIKPGDDMSKFQVEIEHWVHNNICGNGNLIPNNVDPKIYKILNDLYKSTMIKLFYDFEYILMTTKKSKNKVPSLRSLLMKHSYISRNKNLIDEIVDLRNTWFHGYYLFDTQVINGQKKYLDLDYFLNILELIKGEIAILPVFKRIRNDIESYGKSVLNGFFLRCVELTYKIIDNRLISNEKVVSRVATMNQNTERVLSNDSNLYDKSLALIFDRVHEFSVSPYKFTDQVCRNNIYTKLAIYKIYSDESIKINEFDSKSNILYIIKPNLEIEYQCKINGKYLNDYKTNEIIFECDTYVLYKVC